MTQEKINFNYESQELPLSKLVFYEHNAKIHTPEQISAIAKSISEFGFDQPIVCSSDFVIVAGHGRALAAQHLNLQVVPVWVLKDVSDDCIKALRLADNVINAQTGFDVSKLALEMESLSKTYDDSFLKSLSLDFDLETLTDDSERNVDVDTTQEKLEAYENADTKQIVLYFTADEFEIYHSLLDKLQKQFKLNSHSEVLENLLILEGVLGHE